MGSVYKIISAHIQYVKHLQYILHLEIYTKVRARAVYWKGPHGRCSQSNIL